MKAHRRNAFRVQRISVVRVKNTRAARSQSQLVHQRGEMSEELARVPNGSSGCQILESNLILWVTRPLAETVFYTFIPLNLSGTRSIWIE